MDACGVVLWSCRFLALRLPVPSLRGVSCAGRFRLLVIGLALTILLLRPGLLDETFDWPDREGVRAWIDAAGIFGPLPVVALMGVAIVAGPLPSAPIALAVGAAYGYSFGTILVVLGAEFGAIAAFLFARHLGRPFVEHYLGRKMAPGFLGSRNTLTFVVFGR